MKPIDLLISLAACLPMPAWCGPLDERAAEAHLKAIAAGELDALMTQYGDDPWMDWVGGPLDGRYRGADAIRSVWQKFIAANDGLARSLQRSAVTQNANPKGVTLTTTAEFGGKAPVRVRHVLVYRETKLVTEVWQIDPSAAVVPILP